MAEALYRKYRPQVFGDVVGQDHIERTIKNAIDKDQVSHAYLFCGPRGTGKTTTARLLAKALLCEHGPTSEPDGTCQECLEIAEGAHPDVYELDAASRTGVENVREEIIGRVSYAPTRGKYKVYIIDEVHMLSTAAFNALLKTLEEPPSHVVFILCTTDPQKVPDTIHSRCQRFEFHRLSADEIVTRLGAICVAEGVEFEGDALELVAHRAEGGMRNALTSLEQLIIFGEGRVTVQSAEDLLGSLGTSDMAEIMHAVGVRDAAACFTWTASYVESGADLAQFSRDMAEHVRNLYVLSLAGTDAALDIPDAERRQMGEELELFGTDRLSHMLDVLGALVADMRAATNPRLAFEIALTRMVRPDSDLSLEALAERIEALEAGTSAVMSNSGTMAAASSPSMQVAPVASSSPVEVSSVFAHETASEASTSFIDPSAISSSGKSEAKCEAESVPPASAQAAATVAPSAGKGDLGSLLANPAALQRMWMTATGAIKKERQSFAALLVGVHARPAQDGQGIDIVFPATNPISLSMAKKPDMQDLMARSLQAAAGFAVPFQCVPADSAEPAAQIQGGQDAASFAPSAPAVSATPAPEAAPAVPAMPAISDARVDNGLPPEPDTMASATPDPGQDAGMDASDISKMLSDTMGASVVFEEVGE